MTLRSGPIVLVLLFGGALATQWVLVASLRDRLYREHLATAQVALQSLGATLTHAEQLGVPLGRVVGMEELVRSRGVAESGIVALRLLDARGRIVWQETPRSATASDGKGRSQEARSSGLEAAIGVSGRLQAQFVPPDDHGAWIRLAAILLCVTLALALPLLQLARWHDLVREEFTDGYLRKQLEAVRRGDLRIAWWAAGVGSGDARLRFVRDQIFLLNEQYQRVLRLVGSLRRTEPDAERRGQMGALLEALDERFRLAGETGLVDRRVWPVAGAVRCFSTVILLLANVSLCVPTESPYLPAGAAYSALVTLIAWAAGLLAGAVAEPMIWYSRLRAGILAAALTNVLMLPGAGWADLGAHVCGGMASALAARAAIDTAGAYAYRIALAMSLSTVLAGAVLGRAAVAALTAFVSPNWFYVAAALLAIATFAWLSYRLADPPAAGASRVRTWKRLRRRAARRTR